MKQNLYFHPSSNNKGGKSTIEAHRVSHILSILNTKSAINSLQKPYPCVKGPKKKKLDFLYEYSEVLTSFKKVLELKHGYVNHSAPKTLNLKNTISKQLVYEKNVILHDHMRNINHLAKSLTDMEKNYDKKFNKVRNGYTNNKYNKTISENANNQNNQDVVDFKMRNNLSKMNNSPGKNESIDYYEANSIINECDYRNKVKSYDSSNYFQNRGKNEISKEINVEKEENIFLLSQKVYNDSLDLIKCCRDEELLKKNVINFIVNKKIYRKNEFNYLRNILMEKNNLESNVVIINNVMNDVEDQFFK